MKATARIKANLLVLAVAAGAIILSCNTSGGFRDENTEAEQVVSASEYKAAVYAKSEAENQLYQTMAEIDNNLQLIRDKQGLISRKEKGIETASKKEEILATLGEINTLLTDNRKKIEKLNKQLASLRSQKLRWGKQSEEFKDLINRREQEMADLQRQIAEQTAQIAGLNSKVVELETKNAEAGNNLKRMDTEMHKAYYAMGSYKELKQRNIVEKKGGVLGIGRTKKLKADFEKSYFTEIDTRQVMNIPVNSKSAHLVTHHPVGSYEWLKTDGNTELLAITDPEKFWAASRYLVVEVK